MTDQDHAIAIEAARKAYMAAVIVARVAGLTVIVTDDGDGADFVPCAAVSREYDVT